MKLQCLPTLNLGPRPKTCLYIYIKDIQRRMKAPKTSWSTLHVDGDSIFHQEGN
jgi:hypothetical protein